MNRKKPNPIWRRDVLAWCCYDWANSGYTTLVITIFVVYLQRFVFAEADWGNTGAIVWAWGVSASMLIGAVLSPVLGALADAHGSKRFWLTATAMSGGVACVALALVPTQSVWLATACFIVANLCLELSLTVYNGFLPEIANEDEMNRVSAVGMGWGYFGGGLALLIAMVLLSWPSTARLVRGQILQIREEGYVQAARLLGAPTGYLIFRHMIPNTFGVILVTFTFAVPSAIFTEAFLSFIGMGVAPPTPSWGSMCNEGLKTMLTTPHELIAPALLISITVLAFNMLGDGLRDALDARMRSTE